MLLRPSFFSHVIYQIILIAQRRRNSFSVFSAKALDVALCQSTFNICENLSYRNVT